MTWIVAKSFLSGYVAVLSDIQVTWNNGEIRKDCLQKVYPVAPNMVAGFSGSVDLGFFLLNDLSNFIFDAYQKNGELESPRKVSRKWYRRARRIFESQLEQHKKLGVSIIIAGTSPRERLGDSPFERTDIVVIKSKNGFEPKVNPQMKTTSIGSGSEFEAYIEFMEGMDDLKNYQMLADYKPGGAGENFALMASIILQQNYKPGVSSSIHCTLVSTGAIKQFPLEFNTYIGDEKVEHKMPPVCETYNDFQKYQKDNVIKNGAGIA